MKTARRDIDVRLSDAIWPWDEAEGEQLVRRMLDVVEARLGYLREGVLEAWFASDDDLRALNAQFRGKDKPTNVLSFAAPDMPIAGMPCSFGQLALAGGVCRGEAEKRALSLHDHTCHLIIHGLLHMQGYDHQTNDDAIEMETLEQDIMKTLGLHDPYAVIGAPLGDANV